MPAELIIEYDRRTARGRISRDESYSDSTVWDRLIASLTGSDAIRVTDDQISLPWTELLDVLREFGSKSTQRSLNFRFRPTGDAVDEISTFTKDFKKAREARDKLSAPLTADEIDQRLKALGFTERELRDFQSRDLEQLLALPHGANFSVPGAGKTTVTFALHLLIAKPETHLFVVAPKSAFGAWLKIIEECLGEDASEKAREEFVVLDGTALENAERLKSGSSRFLMNYDLMIRQTDIVTEYLARNQVHLVLDESHRIKSGSASQRGAFLINVASLPSRRDILSGTPMPQDASDIASQLKFLWPGHGLDLEVERGKPPREVIGGLYVRTTKSQLGLPPITWHYPSVEMEPGQLALYSVVRSEALRQLTNTISSNAPDYLSARRSVIRLLQLSANPTLALQGITRGDLTVDSGIVEKVLEEGTSSKMRAVCSHARRLAHANEKAVIWTIFTQSILDLEVLLADLNPVSIYGAIASGSEDNPDTREGRIKRFHEDPNCRVLIANPAAAGEGISLHHACHHALYLDRSYVSTHYLQSIDRIHRLGLPPDAETHVHVYRTIAPSGLGSIDLSVSRRLIQKINNLQRLLNDEDLSQITFDEEEADDPLTYDVDLQDLVDLVSELEGHAPNVASEEW